MSLFGNNPIDDFFDCFVCTRTPINYRLTMICAPLQVFVSPMLSHKVQSSLHFLLLSEHFGITGQKRKTLVYVFMLRTPTPSLSLKLQLLLTLILKKEN